MHVATIQKVYIVGESMDYEAVAAAISREVGIEFSDIEEVEGERGEAHWSREKGFTIKATLPVNSVMRLFIVAHECGHVHHQHMATSIKDYIAEYQAELYAIAALERHGVDVSEDLIERAKGYVRMHCEARSSWKLVDPAWSKRAIEWCGFTPKEGDHVYE